MIDIWHSQVRKISTGSDQNIGRKISISQLDLKLVIWNQQHLQTVYLIFTIVEIDFSELRLQTITCRYRCYMECDVGNDESALCMPWFLPEKEDDLPSGVLQTPFVKWEKCKLFWTAAWEHHWGVLCWQFLQLKLLNRERGHEKTLCKNWHGKWLALRTTAFLSLTRMVNFTLVPKCEQVDGCIVCCIWCDGFCELELRK